MPRPLPFLLPLHLFLAWVLVASPVAHATSARAADPPRDSSGGVNRVGSCGNLTNNLYRFCFRDGKWLVDEPLNSRFTNRDRVEVEVQHFNFLRYSLTFDVKEEKSESYQYLTKLWSSVLSPDVASLLSALGDDPQSPDNKLLDNIRELARRVRALERRVTVAGEPYKKTGLTGDQAADLRVAVGAEADPCDPKWTEGEPNDTLLKCSVKAVLKLTDDAYAALERGVYTDAGQFKASIGRQAAQVYKATKDAYVVARDRADKFLTLADRTLGSELKNVGKRDAGVRITLTLAALDAGGAVSPMGDVNYFVETTIPLTAHGGFAFSGIKDVTFNKIKRASGFGEDDLFQKESDGSNSLGFSLFLGWQVLQFDRNQTPNRSKAALLVSLGTDVSKPGRTIFVGPSLLILNRIGVTVGAALGKEENGEQQTLEPDIFKVVKRRPKATWFFSLSTKVL